MLLVTQKLHCCIVFPKLKAGDVISTGQYMNSQNISDLQIKPLLKFTFHSSHLDLRDKSVGKIPFVSVGITRLLWMYRKPNRKDRKFSSCQVEILLNRRIGYWSTAYKVHFCTRYWENRNSIFA